MRVGGEGGGLARQWVELCVVCVLASDFRQIVIQAKLRFLCKKIIGLKAPRAHNFFSVWIFFCREDIFCREYWCRTVWQTNGQYSSQSAGSEGWNYLDYLYKLDSSFANVQQYLLQNKFHSVYGVSQENIPPWLFYGCTVNQLTS